MTDPHVEVLDISGFQPERRLDAVLTRFGAMGGPGGNRIELQSDREPTAELRCLQEAHGNVLDWWPLEVGPPRWRIHVERHDGAPCAPRTITSLMCADHQRLDKLYGRLYKHLEADLLATARERLAEFTVGIRRHMVAEEELLMPVMAERGGPSGPADSAQMDEEHARILAELASAEEAIATAQPGAGREACAALTRMRFVLEGHNQNEERLLYPVCDRTCADEERVRLIRRIQAL